MEPFMELSRRRPLQEVATGEAIYAKRATRSYRRSLMGSLKTNPAATLLAPLHIGDRLPWKLDGRGEPPPGQPNVGASNGGVLPQQTPVKQLRFSARFEPKAFVEISAQKFVSLDNRLPTTKRSLRFDRELL